MHTHMKPDIRRQINSEPFKFIPTSVRSFEQLIDCNVQAGMKSFHSVFSFFVVKPRYDSYFLFAHKL